MEDEEGVSMVDVLKEEEMMEEDANAVLGGSDDKNCTYDMGYVNRQALYACVNCTKDKEKPAGVCLACCLECHDGHELYELYTKRDFRCDCGNKRLSKECSLRSKKIENTDNKYNQNFKGRYCTCHRPYPDPDNPNEDDMIQCIICEDWYHGEHLKTSVPANDDFGEMICFGCVAAHLFLMSYSVHAIGPTVTIKSSETDEKVELEKTDCDKKTTDESSDKKATTEDIKESQGPGASHVAAESKTVAEENKDSAKSLESSGSLETSDAQKESQNTADSSLESQPSGSKKTEEEPSSLTEEKPGSSKDVSHEVKGCYLVELQKGKSCPNPGTIFMSEGWRFKLCRCDKCKKMYSEQEVEFLIREDDTVQAYEERGKAKSGHSQYDQGLAALQSLNRVQQVEALHGYHDLKSSLTSYLKKFADNKKVVRPEDIQEFFAGMQARKKARTQTTAMQHFCR